MVKLIGYGSSILYSVIGVLVLVFNKALHFEQAYHFVAFFSFLGLFYLFARAVLVQGINGKNELSALLFILTSMLPMLVIVSAILTTQNKGEIWLISIFFYSTVTIFDLILLSLQMLRTYRLTSEVTLN